MLLTIHVISMGAFCFQPPLPSESWNDHQHFLDGGHFRLATASEMLVVEIFKQTLYMLI
jgi:hypothetical protein